MELNELVVRRLRSYMLGLLPAVEEEQFENRLMEEADFFREVDRLAPLVQDELVDDYVRGALAADERAAFEQRLGGQRDISDKMSLARALRCVARRRSSLLARFAAWFQPLSKPLPALATVFAVVLVAGAVWTTISSRRANREVELARGESGPAVTAEEPLKAEPKAARAPVVASFVLAPGVLRSGGTTVRIPQPEPGGTVELRLDIGIDEYPVYQAVLENAAGDTIGTYDRLAAFETAETAYVVVRLPAKLLTIDDYQLRLSGITSAGDLERIDRYSFRVVPR